MFNPLDNLMDRPMDHPIDFPMAADGAQEGYDGQGNNHLMVRHVQAWFRASALQLVPDASEAVLGFISKQYRK